MRILIVEDDQEIAKTINSALQPEGFVCDTAGLGEEALEVAKLYDYDLLLLDLRLPDIDGYEVLRRLRASRVNTPALILSGMGDLHDKVKGFDIGADDYLTKPFHRSELVARIRAIVRRSRGHSDPAIRTGKLVVKIGSNTVEIDGQPVRLTPKEYAILELLCLRKGSVLSKDIFLNHLYGGLDEPDERIIDVFVAKLRKKLAAASGGENYIRTVWGRGYELHDPPEPGEASQDPKGSGKA